MLLVSKPLQLQHAGINHTASTKNAYLMAGVADGVGGWSQINVDAGVYSRLLMQTAKAAASILSPSPIAPQVILEEAHKMTNVRVNCHASTWAGACSNSIISFS